MSANHPDTPAGTTKTGPLPQVLVDSAEYDNCCTAPEATLGEPVATSDWFAAPRISPLTWATVSFIASASALWSAGWVSCCGAAFVRLVGRDGGGQAISEPHMLVVVV